MSSYKTYFADVILPVPIEGAFTYRIQQELNHLLDVGYRVVVPFGNRRVLTGIITGIHETPPAKYEAKYILEILDDHPIVTENQLKLWRWIAAYYLCSVGEVLNVAMPAGLKITSESRLQLHPQFNDQEFEYEYTEHELKVLESLQNQDSISYEDVIILTGLKNIYSLVKSLIRKESIIIYEELKDRYKPKKEKRIRLTENFANEPALEEAFEKLSKKEKQLDILLFYLNQVPLQTLAIRNNLGILKKSIQENQLSTSSLNTLIKNGFIEEFEVIVSRFDESDKELTSVELNGEQERCFQEISNSFTSNKPALLHGVTGSGKTEIYIKLIEQVLENGGQALYLLPEIAITTQIVERIKSVFGNKVGVYHSRYSDNERVEVWKGVLERKFDIVIGVRSSIFLPFESLDLVIVDEEHEPSYKQQDPAPRYHARDVAYVLAQIHHANLLLGSATPSFETYLQAKQEKLSLVELFSRFGDSQLPEITLSDLSKARKTKSITGEFTNELHQEILSNLESGKQVLIFQNRRGYAPYLRCNTCGWIPECPNCDVSLTYHLYKNELRCHYCGYKEKSPQQCNACGSTELEWKSYGTEKLEEDLKLMFTDYTVRRMDLDTTRTKYAYQSLIESFGKGEIDILVGTQMITKGLDFDNIGLVGVLDVDRMLHYPDFRSTERTFQLLLQVSGRAGRRETKGKVIIQTFQTGQPILSKVIESDYINFYQEEIVERQNFKYPPFFRLIKITLKHKEKDVSRMAAQFVARNLKDKLGDTRVLGPEEGIIFRIRNLYIYEIMVKAERTGLDVEKIKKYMKDLATNLKQMSEFKNIHLIFDVDPY